MDYLTTMEIAEKWNISRRRVSILCKEGRIKGATLKVHTWLAPSDAKKPDDLRRGNRNDAEGI